MPTRVSSAINVHPCQQFKLVFRDKENIHPVFALHASFSKVPNTSFPSTRRLGCIARPRNIHRNEHELNPLLLAPLESDDIWARLFAPVLKVIFPNFRSGLKSIEHIVAIIQHQAYMMYATRVVFTVALALNHRN